VLSIGTDMVTLNYFERRNSP